MKVSVIIPYYNSEKWIGHCLDSLLNQDMERTDYELIVVDDESTNSVELLNDYVAHYPNIKYICQKHARQSAARNTGLMHATGEYVFFCDADDYVEKNVLGSLVKIAEENQLDILFHNIKKRVRPDEPVKDNFDNDFSYVVYNAGLQSIELPLHNYSSYLGTGVWGFIVHRSFLMDNHFQFDEQMIMLEDRKFVVEMLLKAKRIGKTNAIVYYYVLHPESTIHFLGKKKLSPVYVNNIVSYSKFISTMVGRIKEEGGRQDIIDSFEREINDCSYIALHNAIRFCPIKQNASVIRSLRSFGAYPIRHQGDWPSKVISMMNVYPFWMLACVILHLVPKPIRIKYF